MTPKERAAMQQALDAIGDCSPNKALVHAAYALREALDHSGEANEMVEFFSKEMKNKISVARAEQAEQEPVGDGVMLTAMQHPHNCCVLVDDISEDSIEQVEQTEQEPVATVKTLSMEDGVAPFHYIECNHLPEGTKLYAAPVRTKDLTDDAIDEIFAEYGTIPNTKAVRAVIAADRRKNK